MKRQIHHNNVYSETISQYYERPLTLPFLNHLSLQIQAPFSDRNVTVFDCFFGLPNKVVSLPGWRKNFMKDLDQCKEPQYIKTELDMCEEYWHHHKASPPGSSPHR